MYIISTWHHTERRHWVRMWSVRATHLLPEEVTLVFTELHCSKRTGESTVTSQGGVVSTSGAQWSVLIRSLLPLFGASTQRQILIWKVMWQGPFSRDVSAHRAAARHPPQILMIIMGCRAALVTVAQVRCLHHRWRWPACHSPTCPPAPRWWWFCRLQTEQTEQTETTDGSQGSHGTNHFWFLLSVVCSSYDWSPAGCCKHVICC